jgi:hypothetical protein
MKGLLRDSVEAVLLPYFSLDFLLVHRGHCPNDALMVVDGRLDTVLAGSGHPSFLVLILLDECSNMLCHLQAIHLWHVDVREDKRVNLGTAELVDFIDPLSHES